MQGPRSELRKQPSRRARGLSLVETVVAAAILAIAGLAALELLAESDASSRAARRIALAAGEAEAALARAAESVRRDLPAGSERALDAEGAGEALAGCVLVVSERRELVAIASGSGASHTVEIVRLVAEVLDEDERSIARLERIAPAALEEAP